MGSISVDTIECGLPVICERMTGVKSAAVRWLVPAGDAFDDPSKLGMAPMITEMLERGAGGLDSRGQADAFDRAGVTRSLSNGRVFLQIGGSTIGERVLEALDLFTAIVREPRLAEQDITPARELCLQALASLADDPQHRVTLAARARHRPEPLNRSGYGTEEGLRAIDRAAIADHWAARSVPRGSILAVAGDVDPERIVEHIGGRLGGWAGDAAWFDASGAPPRGYGHEEDDSEQVHVVVVHDGPKESDEEAVLERLLSSVLSGGMSSRLFTEVREKRGLCYAVSAAYRGERDTGTTTAYVGTTPERAQEALDVLYDELAAIGSRKPVTAEELERAKIGMKSRLVFAGESTGARAAALASDFHRVGRPRPLDEHTRAIDAVTLDALNAYAAGRSLGAVTVQTLGPAALRSPAK